MVVYCIVTDVGLVDCDYLLLICLLLLDWLLLVTCCLFVGVYLLDIMVGASLLIFVWF